MKNSQLIGHRGEPETWPENSYMGFEAVLRAGVHYIETDIQITADGVAILSHDPSLLKITGHDLTVTATNFPAIRALSAGYSTRFGDKYIDLAITRLDELAALLKQWPQATAFVEIKGESLMVFGIAMVIDTVLAALEDVLEQVIIISFAYESLVYTREVSNLPIGWVLPAWSADNGSRAQELAPEYLFCNYKRLPRGLGGLWKGSWKWAVYTVNEASLVAPLLKRGIHMVETDVVRKLMAELVTDGVACD